MLSGLGTKGKGAAYPPKGSSGFPQGMQEGKMAREMGS